MTAIIRMLPSFGRHANVVMGYCYQFGVSPLSLKAKKLRNLLMEIKTLFETESFSFEKRRYRISQAGIAEALSIVEKRTFHAPLDSHNYLKKIMIGIADREEKAAGRKAEADLRAREGRLMVESREPGPIPEQTAKTPTMATKAMPSFGPLSDAQMEENRQRLKKMIESIG
jgi:hypothetical protein